MDTTAQMLKSTLAPVRVCAIHFRLSRDRVKPCPGLVSSHVMSRYTASLIGRVGLCYLILPPPRSTYIPRLQLFCAGSMYTSTDCDLHQEDCDLCPKC